MLIDDNALEQRLYRRIVERSGRVGDLVACLSAEEALDWLAAHPGAPVDAVLLDVNMPRVDGLEFLERATARHGAAFARAVAVMLTTALAPRDRARAERFAAVRAFLPKPLTPAQLEGVAGLVDAA